MILEATIERSSIRKILSELGIASTKLGQNDFPDRIFWIPRGRPLLIEFKRPGEKPRLKQKFVHDYLRSLGYEVYVCYSVEEAFSLVKSALETTSVYA